MTRTCPFETGVLRSPVSNPHKTKQKKKNPGEIKF